VNRTRSSEFPNDNPILHEGAIWVCRSPCARPRAVIRPAPVVELRAELRPAEPELSFDDLFPSDPEPLVVEAQSETFEAGPEPCEAAPEPCAAVPEPLSDGYTELVGVMVRVALESGATRAAACLPPLLAGEAVSGELIGEENLGCLIARGFVERSGSIVLLSTAASSIAAAWRGLLRGESADLGACESTLDTWCAALLAAACGTPARVEELRRELRRFGVAAFGLIEQAA
jgi:hypothetical protein